MKKLLTTFFIFIVFLFFFSKKVDAITNRSEIRGWYIADKVDNWDVVAETTN